MYPNYPNNRLIVDGVDLSIRFKMVLMDGYTLSQPSPKTYTVDIPGGNGKLDLTEFLTGDTLYDNRSQEFVFAIIDVKDFEHTKTEISNFLHGKAYDYQITMDPNYTYHGRFTVADASHTKYLNGVVGIIQISIEADPFKFKEKQIFSVEAIGGKTAYFESGRMRVKPSITTSTLTKVICNNKLTTIPQGTWSINDVLFTEGTNEVYFSSYDIRTVLWGDLRTDGLGVTWGGFKDKRLYEWYKTNGDVTTTYVYYTWNDVDDTTWAAHSEEDWIEFARTTERIAEIDNVYIEYDWGDL